MLQISDDIQLVMKTQLQRKIFYFYLLLKNPYEHWNKVRSLSENMLNAEDNTSSISKNASVSVTCFCLLFRYKTPFMGKKTQ